MRARPPGIRASDAEQRALRFRRRPVDFVGEHELRKDRTVLEAELAQGFRKRARAPTRSGPAPRSFGEERAYARRLGLQLPDLNLEFGDARAVLRDDFGRRVARKIRVRGLRMQFLQVRLGSAPPLLEPLPFGRRIDQSR